MFNRLVKYFLENRLVTFIFLIAFVIFGVVYTPFNWHTGFLPRDPIPVDAIPDIGDNQQIVATEWMGRSPKDIQDQVTYPLTTSLLGIPGVKTVRSTSMFGMSFIYVIFNDKVDFYWSRSRILEKLNSLPTGTLPAEVTPTLGPDATALGQIYWYTLEGRDPKTGKPNGGWNPQELRTIQDFYVKYGLSTAEGVSEVASVGGFIKEYQVDINPEALKAYKVSVMDVMNAVSKSNLDIGAETIELNNVEYIIRGLGYVKSLEDLEASVVAVRNNVPVRIKDVAFTSFGPATRRGGLDKGGSETVGAVVVARYGSNPMEVIDNVKDKIKEIEAGLPQKTLSDGSISKVTIVPFYDRTGLIKETIGTLESALSHEILISIIVIIILVLNLRASVIVAGLLPIGVLMTFILMHFFGVDANIVALSGIAIAIGVMVDIGIVDVENILRHLEMPENNGIRGKKLMSLIYLATTEVRAAVVTSIATTIVSFIPVFALEASEGKLFHPLAFTKTFALLSAFILGIVVLPTLVHIFFNIRFDTRKIRKWFNGSLIVAGILFVIFWQTWTALALIAIGINNLLEHRWPEKRKEYTNFINIAITVMVAMYYLSIEWLPLGAHNSVFINYLFVAGIVSIILLALMSMVHYYVPILRWGLRNKWKFLLLPAFTLFFGLMVWMGFDKIFGFTATGFEKMGWQNFKQTVFWQAGTNVFPGTGKEFMPSLNEGSFLLMPTSMPHSSIEKNLEYIETLDKRLSAIPEVEVAVGKWGRVNSALDPAPVQMFENTINYRSEYILDENGHRMQFKVDRGGSYILKNGTKYNPAKETFRAIPSDSLIQEEGGEYFRQWRPEIKKPLDIWNEIVKVTNIPGLTSAPKLQPIETRLVMLSTGMRAPMGLKVYGPDLETIERAGIVFEQSLKEVPSVKASSVFYDRAVGAPYIEIKLNRENMARYGMSVSDVQEILQVAVGGMTLSNSVEGRERFPIRVRYARELRDNPDDLKRILIPSMNGVQIPLGEIADIEYARGAQMIRSENTFLVGYVIFDKVEGKAEVDVVEEASEILQKKIDSGEIKLFPGVSYKFAGNYEQQLRATKRLSIVIPISLLMIFLLLFFQFKTVTASFIHFSGVFVAFAGGFIMLWLYGQDWFLNFSVAGVNLRDLFQMHTINLSVAVWVGFIALFGIATNDGVIMGTYIHQVFEQQHPATVHEVREAVVLAGKKRVRPAMMTTAVAVIALLPVLTSTGKGADIMVPMAIPTFGGMVIQVMTVFVVPLFQSMWREWAVSRESVQTLNNRKNNEINNL
ncbi:MAG TPA: cation transporter [Marinilabiliales bacterium]|nr:MAG: cation transporter [Bacteroidetes bacterium GWE2_40_63]OFY22629.1 MAG: cation transporter [Bacteroidetes bacterium GWF2_40_13]OFZ29557.1 MAG: cation transporter [Bacteroidetes bacterium RIFOXYC2_FULL_40_12]HAN00217.1 cation transporter [Marinilabiliales bacterium]HBX86868.1 cation transporter [Marinilabiliales bacterium]